MMTNNYLDRPWLDSYDDHIPNDLNLRQVSINTLFEGAVEKYRDKVFLQIESGKYTYEEISKMVKVLAVNMIRSGLSKGDRVGLMLPNTPEFVIAYYAILKAGGIVVAINPRYTAHELDFILDKTKPKVMICRTDAVERIPVGNEAESIKLILFVETKEQISSKKPRNKKVIRNRTDACVAFFNSFLETSQDGEFVGFPEIEASEPAILQFSGGTTGTPKAAIGLHRNVTANVQQFIAWCDLREKTETILAAIPLYHVYGMVLAMNLALGVGAKIVLISDPSEIEHILDQIEKEKVTFYPGVPTMYHAINQNEGVRRRERTLRSIKACISGSFTLHKDIKETFERLTGGKLVEGYGLSEAPTATHCNPIYGLNKIGSIGLPLPHVDAKIVDLRDGKTKLKPGEIGEMIIKGPQVMSGYYEDPNETGKVLRDGWLYTGDIAKMDEDGYFTIVDRKKSLIKVDGLQVWPNEVESVIRSHPNVVDCGVAGIPDNVHGEKVVAWVIPQSETSKSTEDLITWCQQKLSHYKIPGEILYTHSLPRSAVGKLLRRELRKRYQLK